MSGSVVDVYDESIRALSSNLLALLAQYSNRIEASGNDRVLF